MEKLFTPHLGLMVWTIVTFVLLVFVLGKFGWKPLMKGLEEREDFLRREREGAEEARKAAETLKAEYDKNLAQAQSKVQGMLKDAEKDAQQLKDTLLKTAQEDAARVVEKTRRDLQEEQRRLVAELRGEVALLSVSAAEKMLKRSVDKAVQDEAVKEASAQFEAWGKKG